MNRALESPRETPRQGRAKATLATILEAAIQLLERDGEAGFNTNAIAERAGVSIGTVYRYFPDKRAILIAVAQQETLAHQARVAALLADNASGMALDRALIRAFVQGFEGRSRARRIAVAALLSYADPGELVAGFADAERAPRDSDGEPLDRIRAFILTRAITGALRAAVFEAQDFLHDRAFEDELVRLSRAYLGYPIKPRPRTSRAAPPSRTPPP